MNLLKSVLTFGLLFAAITANAQAATEVDYYRVNTAPCNATGDDTSPDTSPSPSFLPAAAKNGEGEFMNNGYITFKLAAPGSVTPQRPRCVDHDAQ